MVEFEDGTFGRQDPGWEVFAPVGFSTVDDLPRAPEDQLTYGPEWWHPESNPLADVLAVQELLLRRHRES